MDIAYKRRLQSLLITVTLFIVWELVCIIFSINELILPRPSQIIDTLIFRLPSIWPHAVQTLYTTMVGFLFGILVGVLLGVIVGSSRLAYEVADPLLVGFASIPKVAIVPILVLWFGAGTIPAVITAMVTCVFPIIVNVATGLATIEPEMEEFMKTIKSTKLERLINIGMPRAMPYFFASLEVSITLAFVGSVISETIAANKGIGNLMIVASSTFDTKMVFAGLFVIAFFGIVLHAIFAAIDRRVTGWATRSVQITT